MYTLRTLEKEGAPPLLRNVNDSNDWMKKRTTILNDWLNCIGGIPPLVKTNKKIISWEVYADYYLIRIRYASVYNDWVPANLLIPKSIEQGELRKESDVINLLHANNKNKFPAVIALHPTSDNGKEDISSSSGRENRKYALELVKRGYIVLAPDTITAGERVHQNEKPFQTASFYKSHPEWSAVAKMIVDHQQGISLLEELTIVEHSKIGAIGHSLGGYNSYFLATVDKRIKAVICSCGFSLFEQDPEIHRWGRREWFTHLPKVSDYLDDGNVPFEFHEIAALVAPTPFFLWMGQNDKIFPHWKPAAVGLVELNSLYDWLGESEKIKYLIGNSGHDFPFEIRQIAYSFLDYWLCKN